MAMKAPVLFGGFPEDPSNAAGIIAAYRISAGPRYEVLGLHGFGQILGVAVASVADAAAVLRDCHMTPGVIGASIRGALSIVVNDLSTGQRHLLADPFGGGLVFLWKDARRWCASSSLPTLIAFLASHRIHPRRSLGYAAALGLIGNGGLFPAPYEGIEVLLQFSYICQRDGRAEILRYPGHADFVSARRGDDGHYQRMLEVVADEIVENIEVVSQYPATTHIAHLTGGLDSRTIVAGLTRTDQLHRFELFTSGPSYTPDVIVASQVAGHFGLSVTDDSGLRQGISPANATQADLWAMHETGGVLPGPAHVGMTGPADSVVLSGGYSLLRSYYGTDFDPAAPRADKEKWLVDAMLGVASPYRGQFEGGLFAPSVIERAYSIAGEMIEELEEWDLPPDVLPDHAFFRVRSRYYTGEIQRSLSPYVHRSDPLYASHLLPLAYCLPRTQRLNGFVQLDLNRQLNQELMLLPYDAPRISDAYRQARPTLPPETTPRGNTSQRRPALRLRSARGIGSRSQAPTAAQEAEAQRIGAPVRLVMGAEASQKNLRTVIEDLGDEALKDTFNLPQLRRIAEVKPRSRPLYRSLNTLNTTLSWFLES